MTARRSVALAALAGSMLLGVSAVEAGSLNKLSAVESGEMGGRTSIRLRGSSTPIFTVYKLDNPDRVVVDISNAKLSGKLAKTGDGKVVWRTNTWGVSSVSGYARSGGKRVRLVVALARASTYKVKASGNDLLISVTPHEKPPATTSTTELEAERRAVMAQRVATLREAEKLRKARAAAEREARRAKEERRRAESLVARAESMRAQARDEMKEARQAVEAARISAAKARSDAETRRQRADERIAEARRLVAESKARIKEAARAEKTAKEATRTARERERAAAAAKKLAAHSRAKFESARASADASRRAAEQARKTGDARARKLAARAEELEAIAERRRRAAQSAARDAKTKRAQAAQAASAARKKTDSARAELASAREQLRIADSKRALAEKARALAESRRKAAEADAGAAEKRVAELRETLESLVVQVARAKKLRAAELQSLHRAEAARSAAEARQREAAQAAARVEASLRALREAKNRAHASLTAAKRAAAQARSYASSTSADRKTLAELRRKADALSAEHRKASAALKAQRRELESRRAKAAALSKRRDAAVAELDTIRSATARAAGNRQKEETRLAELATQRKRAEVEYAQLRAAAARAATERTAEERKLANARTELASVEQRLARATAKERVAKRALSRTQSDIAAAKAEIAAVKAEAVAAKAEAAKLASVERRLASATAKERVAKRALSRTQSDIAAARAEVAAAKAEATKLAQTHRDLQAQTTAAEARLKRAKAALVSRKRSKPDVRFREFDYRHRDSGARVVLGLSSPATPRVIEDRGRRATLLIPNVEMSDALEKTIDTSRFGGPVRAVSAYRDRKNPRNVRVVVELDKPTRGMLKRVGNTYYWDFPTRAKTRRKPRATSYRAPSFASARGTRTRRRAGSAAITQASLGRRGRRVYRGRPIDLDFKDADIHNLLRLLADVGGVNIVIPDEIKASVTVRLRRVPWDQAMEVILASKGLWYRRQGDLIRIAPRKDLDAEDKAEAERRKAMVQAEPPEPEIFTLNYTQASQLRQQLQPLLSPKGRIEIDQRTNSLIVNDLRAHRRRIIDLARRLDTQTPQIQIEARIVEARTTFVREFGIQWGGNATASQATGNATGLIFPNSVAVAGAADDGQTANAGVGAAPTNFAVNLPAAIGSGAGGGLGFSFGSVGGNFNINLRLSALEDIGTARIVSSPKITVINNVQASISSGVSIPISVVSANGVQTQFVPADLSLQVTPTVSQRDCTISMNVNVTKNEPDFANTGARGDPSIIRREAKTTIIVADGETAVIGGVYTRNTGRNYNKVPFLADIPVIGLLFKSRRDTDDRSEVLVFLTPKITNRAFLQCEE